MADRDTIMRERQLVVQREMSRRGISLKAVHLDSGIPYNTVKSYFPGERDAVPAVIPMSAVFTLADTEALSLDLLSLLLPDGLQIVRASEEIDLDWLADQAEAFTKTKMSAHRADSPAGVDICAIHEKPELLGKAAILRAAP